ncbi:MAG: helix-turn-helix transcriptional regulator [Lachnospiraceae bacterium]|nr:helix-turn-helix transcriptional regulator [Lachnospiraceae bacterium]
MVHERLDDITSNLSVRIFKGYGIKHGANWHERKIKRVYTIWSITRGKIWIRINNREFFVEKGGVVFFYPNDSYTAHTDENGCEFVYIFFSLEMGGGFDLLSDMNLAGIVPAEHVSETSLTFCSRFVSLYTITQQASLRTYSLFTGYLCDLIELLRSDVCDHFYPYNPGRYSAVFSPILDYIAEHYREDISVKQLALSANLSEKRFIHNFKQVVGTAPGQYISQLRMRKAAELLAKSSRSLSEIAHELGYCDQYAFSKAFKRSYGEAPSVFRRSAVLDPDAEGEIEA